MRSSFRPYRLLPLFAILILGAGCGGDASPAADTADVDYGDPVPGGTAVINTLSDITTPITILAQGVLDGNLGGDVLNMSLLKTEWSDGRLVFMTADESPLAIARSWEYVGADSAALRYHMRSDVNWSDGEPLTADDVVFTYDLLMDPAIASPVQNYGEAIDSVVAENDSTVVFYFERRYPEMFAHSDLQPVPEHALGGVPRSEFRTQEALRNPQNGNLPTSGPWIIGNWERGTRIVLDHNPEFEPKPLLDQIVFRVIPDATTRLVELQTGGSDFEQTIALDQLPMLRQAAPNVRYEVEEKRFYDFIGYNPDALEAFADPEIRRALGMALNRQGIVSALQMDEYATVAGGPYPPIFQDHMDPEGQAPLPYDPDAARRILEEKGWVDADGDGVREKDGTPFSFTLVTNVGNQRRADVTQIVQQQWREVGVEAELRTVEFNTLNQNLVNHDFDAVLYGWSVGLTPDLTPVWSADSPFNFVSFESAEASRLMNEALRAPTYEQATPLWRQAANAIVAEQPYTWLYYMDAVDGVNNRLRNVKVDTYGPYQNSHEWWIPESLRRGGPSASTPSAE